MSVMFVHARIDIRREVCPMTYVRTKLKLESMAKGETLEVLMSEGEATRNVPRSAAEEGHQILSLEPSDSGTWRLLIRKE